MNVETITAHMVKFFTDEINDANYKAIKNIIHNEAQISKSELKEIIIKEITKIVKEIYVKEEITNMIRDIVKNEIAKILGEDTWRYSKTLNENVQKYIYQIITTETRKIIRDEIVGKLNISMND